MKRRHRKNKKAVRAIRLWSQEEADKAVPYLRSVTGSLREHWLAVQSHRRDTEKQQLLPKRPGRDRLMAEEATRVSSEQATDRFEDALYELATIDVFLLDPVQGLALIPFRKEDDLAWFIFDRFDERGLVGWRLHNDPMEERRALSALVAPVSS